VALDEDGRGLSRSPFGVVYFSDFCILRIMEHRLSATELARTLGDVLGRIRYRGDSFVIERNGDPVARIGPLAERPIATVREVAVVWRSTEPDPDLGADLETVDATDRPPGDRWGS
jgi:antitoxin (DNA-binding transcriptional repressor) of toxin-antitoxin stability system